MYIFQHDLLNQIKLEPSTFVSLGIKEADIEEMLRKNIDIITDENEDDFSMLIIGQQVTNESNGRSDLTAIDNEGNLVLIEIKRDKKDISQRREALEFQAIRYAAGFATIKSIDLLVRDIYAPYIEKHMAEFKNENSNEFTASEIAHRKLTSFFKDNNITEFNKRQRIILIASDFDEQTLSAVAWLNSNKVDISCYKITPMTIEGMPGNFILSTEKILPLADYNDFYVKITTNSKGIVETASSTIRTHRSLPKIDWLIEQNVVEPGDQIKALNREDTSTLLENGNIKLKDGSEISLAKWLRDIYGWSSIQTYNFALHVKTQKTLAELREEKIKDIEQSSDKDNSCS